MYSTPTLATRYARNTRVMRRNQPQSEVQLRAAAPSVFAEGKHASRIEGKAAFTNHLIRVRASACVRLRIQRRLQQGTASDVLRARIGDTSGRL